MLFPFPEVKNNMAVGGVICLYRNAVLQTMLRIASTALAYVPQKVFLTEQVSSGGINVGNQQIIARKYCTGKFGHFLCKMHRQLMPNITNFEFQRF